MLIAAAFLVAPALGRSSMFSSSSSHATVVDLATSVLSVSSSDFVVLTSGSSCAAAGLTAIIDATECKAANVAASGPTVALASASFLAQARKDEPHGCIRNCWHNRQ